MQEIVLGDRSYKIERSEVEGEIIINGQRKTVDVSSYANGHYHMIIDGKSVSIEVVKSDAKEPQIKVNGHLYEPQVKDDTDLLLERLGMNIKAKKAVKELKAPMPGLVLDIKVEVGQVIKEGQPLVVLEAMKMENVLKSPTDATVKSIAVKKGDAIDKNTLLIAFE